MPYACSRACESHIDTSHGVNATVTLPSTCVGPRAEPCGVPGSALLGVAARGAPGRALPDENDVDLRGGVADERGGVLVAAAVQHLTVDLFHSARQKHTTFSPSAPPYPHTHRRIPHTNTPRTHSSCIHSTIVSIQYSHSRPLPNTPLSHITTSSSSN